MAGELSSFLGGFTGSTIGSAVVRLVLDSDTYNRNLTQSEAKLKGFSTNAGAGLSRFGAASVAAWTVFGTAAISGISSAITAAAEAEQVFAQTEAVVRSTGGAAGLTAEEMAGLASRMQGLTTFTDEAVLGLENVLATFTRIQGPTFTRATEAILDMSTALGTDLQSATIQVGKALNDPIAGLTSLRRVGVAFTESQRAMIEELVRAGDVMGAQDIILGELSKEFGGSAKAATDTFAGGLAQLRNQLGELQESFGVMIVEVIQPFVSEVAELSDNIRSLSDDLGGGGGASLAGAVKTVAVDINPLVIGLRYANEAFEQADSAMGGIAATASPAAGAIEGLQKEFDRLGIETTQTSRRIQTFAGLSGQNLKEFRDDTVEAMRESFGSISEFDTAFTITARQFQRNAKQMAKEAKQFTIDLRTLEELNIGEPIKKALLEEGVGAVHAFVESNRKGRQDIVENIKISQRQFGEQEEAIERMTGKLNDVDGRKAKATVEVRYVISGEDPSKLPGLAP